jgi:hypothetical protein
VKSSEKSNKTKEGVPKLKPDDELHWDAIYAELGGYFISNKEGRIAKAALTTLVAAGCNEKWILQNLFLFCGGGPKPMQDLRRSLDFGRSKKKMLAIAKLLAEASSEIAVAEELAAELGITTHNLTPDRSKLAKYADLLQRLGRIAYQDLASHRISGRDQHLVYLCRMINIQTGKPHYSEIADLVNATRQFYDLGSPELTTAESIRKRVARYGLLDLGSELELAELKELLRTTKNIRK